MKSSILIIALTLCSCATQLPIFSNSRVRAREVLTVKGQLVKIMSSKRKCDFLKSIETKVFIAPYPILTSEQRANEKQKKNKEDAIIRLKNITAKLNGNAISDIEEVDDFSNWDRSKPLKAKAYYCKFKPY